jgi:hypothetical protein
MRSRGSLRRKSRKSRRRVSSPKPKFTVKELKEICKQKGIKGFSKWNKPFLIQNCLHGNIQRRGTVRSINRMKPVHRTPRGKGGYTPRPNPSDKKNEIPETSKNPMEDFYKILVRHINDVKSAKSQYLRQTVLDFVPANGTISNLLIFLDAGEFYDNISQIENLKPGSYVAALLNITIGNMENFIDLNRRTIQENLQKMAAAAPVVVHDANSPFAKEYITETIWNSFGYTQVHKHSIIKVPMTGKSVNSSIKNGKWSTRPTLTGFESLFNIANFPVNSKRNDEVLMFHGSTYGFADALKSAIDWTKGGGALGMGFYMTFNPNEAKLYACDRSRALNTDALILEIVIKNSNDFIRRFSNSWNTLALNDGDFVRNALTGWQDQVAVRDSILGNMEIKRIHVFKKGSITHHGMSSAINFGFTANKNSPGYKC